MENHQYLERFIDIIFAFIVGFAVFRFSSTFQIGNPSFALADIGNTLIYLSAACILIYDWVAYHVLIEKLPYSLSHYFTRFLVDLCIFYVMYLLFLAVPGNITFYLLLVSILFFLILTWHLLAWYQVKSSNPSSSAEKLAIIHSGIKSSFVSFALAFLGWMMLWSLPPATRHSPILNIVVAVLIIAFCAYRYVNVLKKS